MFADHQPQISLFARLSADNLRRVVTFAVCTIRMPLLDAAKDTPLAIDGRGCRSIFGNKHNALAWLRDNADDLYDELEYLWHECASDDAMLRTVMRVPGIGLAKAGFVLQMAYGISGCLDTHNLARFGIPPRRYASGQKAVDRRRIAEYNDVCQRLGGTAHLWDSWCEYLAETQLGRYDSAEQISGLHLAPLC